MKRFFFIGLMLTAPVSWCWGKPVPFADNKASVLCDASYVRPNQISSSKTSLIKDGMTLKALIEAVGPGWVTPSDSVGVIRWYFSNGQVLSVKPTTYAESDVLQFHPKDNNSRMYWN